MFKIFQSVTMNLVKTLSFQFLYSDGDKMMPSAFIERVYEEQKKSGTRSVQKYNFGNSNHVAHLREKPQEYEVQMSRFLKPILESTR